jgi:uncharacterized protein
VVDAADLLPAPTEQKLAARLAEVERKSKHQFVVVTVTNLGAHSVEDYSLKLANSWGIGRKSANDGVVLLVAPKERKVRIEIGYGLEKALTDAQAETIVQTEILPRFREQKMADGIVAGSDAIIREITS